MANETVVTTVFFGYNTGDLPETALNIPFNHRRSLRL
jgi:hypothetical protein